MHYQTILLQISSDVSDLQDLFASLNLANNFPPLDPNHPDSIIVNASGEGSIGIGEISNLQSWIHKKPFQSENKIAVIHLADNLTVQAQNSLLKTLEEPPAHTLIVLTALNPKNLLDTILSRTTVVHTKLQETTITAELQEQVTAFLRGDYLTRLKLVEGISQPHKFLTLLANMLISDPNLSKNEKVLKWDLIKTSLKALNSNVQPKITLENLSLWLSEY